jgi:integrase
LREIDSVDDACVRILAICLIGPTTHIALRNIVVHDDEVLAENFDRSSRFDAGYESLFRVWVLHAFGDARLDRIDPIAVEAWMTDMKRAGLSASRIRQAHQALNAVLKAAVKNKYLASNPAEGVSLPRTRKKEQRFLTSGQLDDLAQAIEEPYGTLVYLLGYGGLRWGEATALRRRRIDVLRARVEVAESVSEVSGKLIFGTTKSHRSRTIALPRSLRDMLNTHLNEHVAPDPDALVFTMAGRTYKTKTYKPGTPLRNSNFAKRMWRPGSPDMASTTRPVTLDPVAETVAACCSAPYT